MALKKINLAILEGLTIELTFFDIKPKKTKGYKVVTF